jgi:hypothetical protein
MKNERALEKIYDLLEIFGFDELKTEEQELVLNYMSKADYENMRSSITDTRGFFSTNEPEVYVDRPSVFKRIAYLRIEFYKVAAAILILCAAGFAVSLLTPKHSQNLLAVVDTVYIKQTDTLIIRVTDIVERIVEKPIYKVQKTKSSAEFVVNKLPESTIQKVDCAKEMCPEDLQKLTDIKNDNSFSNDKYLADFMVPIQ